MICPILQAYYLFADDANIYFSSKNLSHLETTLNCELKSVAEWMKCNRLALSISKTNFILFHSSKLKPNQSLRIKIDDTPIKQVDSTKYLGITFDSNLTWKIHINELCLSKVRRFICQQTCSCHALLLSYLSFPHLWRPCLRFNLSLISNTTIYYPKTSNQNNIFLRTKIPF